MAGKVFGQLRRPEELRDLRRGDGGSHGQKFSKTVQSNMTRNREVSEAFRRY
jgi:hypothetical protein